MSALTGSPGLEEGSGCPWSTGHTAALGEWPKASFSLSSLVVNLDAGYFSVLFRFCFWFSVGL